MRLNELTLSNFKNITETRLELSGKVNCFLGNNGMGKSNLLDAVYFLSFCKSFSGINDRLLISRGEDWAIIKGLYERKGMDEELVMGLSSAKRKSIKRGGKEYQRLSMHIGAFPLVMVAPQDIDLIRGGGEERRRWMDMVISQSDPQYLDALIRYNKGLEQRNRLLRDGCVDPALYGAVEVMMEMSADYLCRARTEWISNLTVIFDRYYTAIAGEGGEHVTLRYESHLNRPGVTLATLMDEARRHDEIVKHTSVGPHRDDIEMVLDDMPMRRTGSQGQCKTFTIALRLAQYDFLRESTGMRPILLLDDIFDKLDASRVERIMGLVTGDGFGQIFITDTNRTHLDEIMGRTGGDYRLWRVEGGRFTQQ
ncbi:DNA replication and repair protein RecF [Duncaniella freteri]|uniref:DNA replication/repair protein RecF n=2 Tax=Duncaniella TaxID=2518495 RepID=UPI0025555FF4|nr:DNA replication and repair protein RecF [Duncaniella freteri]